MKGGMISLEKQAVAADAERASLNKTQTLAALENCPKPLNF